MNKDSSSTLFSRGFRNLKKKMYLLGLIRSILPIIELLI